MRLAASFRGWIRAEAGMRRMLLVNVVALLTFTAALVGGFLEAARMVDDITRANERSLLTNQLRVTARALLEAQNAQVTRDDAMRAAGGQGGPLDTRWTDIYFGQLLTTMIKADDLVLVAPDGRVLRGWRDGKASPTSHHTALGGPVRRIMAELRGNRSLSGKPARLIRLEDTMWPIDAEGRPLTRWSSSIVIHRGRPAIMTIVALSPDGAYGLLRRTPNHLIALRMLNGRRLREIGGSALLKDLRFSPVQPGARARNALTLEDRQGRAIGSLTWVPNTVGTSVLVRTAPLLAGYLLFYIIVLILGTVMIRGALRLARELTASEAQAKHIALHDPLLGLPNRTYVMQRISVMLAAARRERGEGRQVVLAIFDLDRFKAINDSVGHPAGDDLLVQVVARVRARLQPADVLGRLASDEFVVLRSGSGGQDAAADLGKAIMAAFAEPFAVFGNSLMITASCGIAWGPDQAGEAKDLLRNADIALSCAKQRGRGRYRWFTRDMDATIRWRQDMELELRRAIAMDGLTMVYQPIVNVVDRSIVSFEALLRWHHRDRGDIGPGVFVPVAESCGLMPRLGDWVLRRVFADSHDFGNAEISVNLSPLQLMASDFLPNLRALIDEEQLDPSRFTFEITEGVLLDRSERVIELLTALQGMGFRIALDDFGTGYSSLGYLRSFQFDRIKIDRSFVQGIEGDLDAQSILRAIVALGRTLRMKVVAEGVETLLQQRLVQAAGCLLIQGHLYWRALTPEQVIAVQAGHRTERLLIAV